MLRVIDLRVNQALTALPRAGYSVDHAMSTVTTICDDVRERGAAAIVELSERFDHVSPQLRVPPDAIERAVESMDPAVRQAVTEAIRRRRAVCEQTEKETPERTLVVAPGASVTTRIEPVRRVGLYVPGGLAPLASSVLMNAVPAQVAGVASIAVASSPQARFGGLPDPVILGVCGLLGLDEVYSVGGAQAIAMFAYGVPGLCEPVDVVTGPGNVYVAAAKRHLQGVIGIDAEAGPTEIAVLADAGANPLFVAADLVSQAEHDPLAGAVLVTDSPELADAVQAQVEELVGKHSLRERLQQSLTGDQSAIVLVCDIDQGLAVVDAYGAEHLEVMTADAPAVAARVRNAGAIFVGPYSPVSLGDYAAGSTHVLPTGGTAKFASGLTVRSFTKVMHVIDYSADALAVLADDVEAFAMAESLPGHAQAISVRRGS
ncbi:MAG: histidinol dehydrogenase [Propionibacteriaceae bacterium]|nr:histidinol dehydrogenase [Propionibacteriaceae bacterium]